MFTNLSLAYILSHMNPIHTAIYKFCMVIEVVLGPAGVYDHVFYGRCYLSFCIFRIFVTRKLWNYIISGYRRRTSTSVYSRSQTNQYQLHENLIYRMWRNGSCNQREELENLKTRRWYKRKNYLELIFSYRTGQLHLLRCGRTKGKWNELHIEQILICIWPFRATVV